MTEPTRIDDSDDDLRPDITVDTPSGAPIWPDPLQHGPQFHTHSGQPRPARWCSCGAPWIGERCGTLASAGRDPANFPGHTPGELVGGEARSGKVYRGARRRLHWGPFTVAMLTTFLLNIVLLSLVALLLDAEALPAFLGAVTLAVLDVIGTVLFVASGIAALLRKGGGRT